MEMTKEQNLGRFLFIANRCHMQITRAKKDLHNSGYRVKKIFTKGSGRKTSNLIGTLT